MRQITGNALENLRAHYLNMVAESLGRYDGFGFISDYRFSVLHRISLNEVSWVVRGDRPVRQLLADSKSFTTSILEHFQNMTVLEIDCGGQRGVVYITRGKAALHPLEDLTHE